MHWQDVLEKNSLTIISNWKTGEDKMKRYIVVSMGGVSSVGGVERVMYYLDEILEKNNTVSILLIENIVLQNISSLVIFLLMQY